MKQLESIFTQNIELDKLINLTYQGPQKDFLVISRVPIALRETLLIIIKKRTNRNIWYTSQSTKGIQNFLKTSVWIKKKDLNYKNILESLNKLKYLRVDRALEIGEYSIKGDTLSIKSFGYSKTSTLILSFYGKNIEKIELVDDIEHTKRQFVDNILLFDNSILLDDIEKKSLNFYGDVESSNKEDVFIVFADLLEADIIFDFNYPPIYFNNLKLLNRDLERYIEKEYSIYLSITNKKLKQNLEFIDKKYINKITILDEAISSGFISDSEKVLLLTEKELFASLDLSVNKPKGKASSFFDENIKPGQYVVHEDYGVAIYRGIVRVESLSEEYFLLEYAEKDKLYIPYTESNKLTKFIGEDGIVPNITRLGKGEWGRVTSSIKKSIKIIAKELLEHMAIQEVSKATAVSKETSDYNNLCNDFEFELTSDQKQSIKEISEDLDSTKPMNRLLVGDVGFGKTEVALRVAFKAVEAGLQVAILCPTTILAYQHFSLFKKRLEKYAVNIGLLSSFNLPKENLEVIDKLSKGNIDIVIGTHRLLSRDIKAPKLGLLIIDEEQRFGVKQKEKIKALRYGVHVLSMSATPIPRTLSLALSKIQSLSIINTPPLGRKPVITSVSKLNWEKVKEIIEKEVNRGGQIYFVHNRVSTIEAIRARLKNMLPNVRFAVAHGQMAKHNKSSSDLTEILEENNDKPSSLEKVIIDFYFKKYDVLICTTIIENGIDMPNVNTIIIDKAQNFGLSELYQLRGRVGRSEKQAYCFAFYEGDKIYENEIQEDIEKNDTYIEVPKDKDEKNYIRRLKTLLESQELGAGFKVATRDLQIRGAGNILGKEQSGKINLVGYSLYLSLLEEEIEKQRKSKIMISPLENI